ncbi:hypothetical protein Tco_1493117 [Tanacetum coccineum]
MASDDSDQDARYALSKLLQRGTVAEYESEFLMLIKRVTGISESLRKSFFYSGLKTALQCATVRSYPLTLGEAFFRACIIEARFEDENNQAVDTNVGDQEDPAVKDKQEVKKVDDQEIENNKDEEGKNEEDQQVSETDDNTNNDVFYCSLPPHKGVNLTEEVAFENTTSYLIKDKDEQDNNLNGVFNDGGEIGYNKADGTWVHALRIEDGWYLFDGLGLSKEPHSKSNLDVNLQFHVDRQDIGSQVKTWDPEIKSAFQEDTLRARWFRRSEECYAISLG